MALRFTGAQVPPESMLMGVRWDGADPLSTRHVEARMADRGGTSLTPRSTGGSASTARGGRKRGPGGSGRGGCAGVSTRRIAQCRADGTLSLGQSTNTARPSTCSSRSSGRSKRPSSSRLRATRTACGVCKGESDYLINLSFVCFYALLPPMTRMLTLVANCLECPRHLGLTSYTQMQRCGFCEFATSVNVDTGGELPEMA